MTRKQPNRPPNRQSTEFAQREASAIIQAFRLVRAIYPYTVDINTEMTNRGARIDQGFASPFFNLPEGIGGRPAGLDAFIVGVASFEVPHGFMFDKRIDTPADITLNVSIGRERAAVTAERYQLASVRTLGYHEAESTVIDGVTIPGLMHLYTPAETGAVGIDHEVINRARDPEQQQRQRDCIGWLAVIQGSIDQQPPTA